MKRTNRRTRGWRRWLVAVPAALILLIAGVWLMLPTLLETAITRLARSAGAEDVTVQVQRASLSSLALRDFDARVGPLAISLPSTLADYSLASLLQGNLGTVVLDGLTLTIDCTRLEGDWLQNLRSDVNADGETAAESPGFRWPVDRLALNDAALVLQFPDARYRLPATVTAARRPDGTVAFALRSDHPSQALQVSGAITPSTLDGTVRVERSTVDLEIYRRIATELGLLSLPAGIEWETGTLTVEADLHLEGGEARAMTGRVELPRLEIRRNGIRAELTEVLVETKRDRGELIEATARGTLAADDPETGWAISPSTFHASFDGEKITFAVSDILATWRDSLEATANIRLESGPLAKIEPFGFSGTIALTDWRLADLPGGPADIRINGNSEKLQFELDELHAPGDLPFGLHDVQGTIAFSSGNVVATSGRLVVLESLAALLPDGWQVNNDDTTWALGDLTLTVTERGAAYVTSVDLTPPASPGARMEAPQIQFRPELQAHFSTDAESVKSDMQILLQDLQIGPAGTDLGIIRAEAAINVPSMSLDGFLALLAGDPVEEDLELAIAIATSESSSTLASTWRIRHTAEGHAWSAEGETKATMPVVRSTASKLSEVSIESTTTLRPIPQTTIARAWGDQPIGLFYRELLQRLSNQVTWSASSIELPGATHVQWASGTAIKKDSGLADVSAQARAGIVQVGPERLEQLEVDITVERTIDDPAFTAQTTVLLEGEPLETRWEGALAIDWAKLLLRGNGSFELTPLIFRNSGVASRWLPDYPGIVFSGTIGANGAMHFGAATTFDGTLSVNLQDGAISYPELKARVEGLDGALNFSSILQLKTEPDQEFRFATAHVRDFDARDGYVRLRLDGVKRVYVEESRLHVFDGEVSTGPFSLFFPNPDVAVIFEIDSIDAGELVDRFELFDGKLTGRLNGRLPVALLAGRPLIGQGYLELDRNSPATLSVNAQGLFTGDLPNRTLPDKLNRLGYELAEEGLENLTISNLHVDLFRRDLPNTPIRIELAGAADTPRANVPMNIVTNVNGSVDEVLDLALEFLLR